MKTGQARGFGVPSGMHEVGQGDATPLPPCFAVDKAGEPGELIPMAATPPPLALDSPAPDFREPGTDGRTYALDDIAGENGTVIVFICNHCPYVVAVIDRLVADARALMAEGIGFAAICSNDATAYPANSFEAMQRFARAHAFPFPYLHDEDQSVARAYGAVCTPDFLAMTRTAG